jgi:hypothetical protein
MFRLSSRPIVLFPAVFAVLALPSVLNAAGQMMRTAMMARPAMMTPTPMMSPGMQSRMMPGTMGMPFGQNFTPMGTNVNPYAFSGPFTGSNYLMNPGYGYSGGSGYSGGYGANMMTRQGYSGNYSGMMSQGGYSSGGAGTVGGTQQYSSVQGSGLDWPLGTRLLADGEPLRRKIDASVQSLMSQSAQGRVDPEQVARTIRDIDELRAMIVRQGTRGVVSNDTIKSAVQFLDDLAASLRSM